MSDFRLEPDPSVMFLLAPPTWFFFFLSSRRKRLRHAPIVRFFLPPPVRQPCLVKWIPFELFQTLFSFQLIVVCYHGNLFSLLSAHSCVTRACAGIDCERAFPIFLFGGRFLFSVLFLERSLPASNPRSKRPQHLFFGQAPRPELLEGFLPRS